MLQSQIPKVLLISNFVTLSLSHPSGPLQVDLTTSPQSSKKIKLPQKSWWRVGWAKTIPKGIRIFRTWLKYNSFKLRLVSVRVLELSEFKELLVTNEINYLFGKYLLPKSQSASHSLLYSLHSLLYGICCLAPAV